MLDTTPAAPGLSERETAYKRKLIEIALPLQSINRASTHEKSHTYLGHPAGMHLWWARRPLASCRAILFASLVDDPSSNPEQFPTAKDQEHERKRLFDLIEQLVRWENSRDERVLSQAREEIRKSVGDPLPTVYDPFCGGGAIAIEAQRLGLPTLASDLNPVAVLITKALTEIPWRFKTFAPVHPSLRGPLYQHTWQHATGLAADIEAYGMWMLEEARRRIGSFYPTVSLPGGAKATVVAWLWARTVRCPNPLCGAEMPLIKSFALSTKASNEWRIEPVVDQAAKLVRYDVCPGKPTRGGTVDRRGAQCIVCNEPVALSFIRSEGKARRIGSQMTAIVGEGQRGRVYLPPNDEHVRIARSAIPSWTPNTNLPDHALGFRVQGYGMSTHRDLFTSRQLLAITTFSDLVRECRERVLADAITSGLQDDGVSLECGGTQATAYADAISTYLAFIPDKLADYNSSLCSWHIGNQQIRNVFTRQTVSMVWDFVEANPMSGSSGNFLGALRWIQQAVAMAVPAAPAQVFARDAAHEWNGSALFCTDPPYYDNVPYADLSDFFYTWLRASIGARYPDLLAPLLVPKLPELVAEPARFGGNHERARQFFEEGLRDAFRVICVSANPCFPTTIFYAFKQADTDDREALDDDIASRASIGWEAMINAVITADLEIIGTWPMSSERANRPRGQNANALSSSIVFTCRPRSSKVLRSTRSDFLTELRSALPIAVRNLRDASLAATDLEQAAIGPGMAVFSRYSEVLEADGKPMSIRSALALINQQLTQIILGDISEVDAESQFALAWFDRHFYDEAKYGEAELLLKAKNATLNLLRESGAVRAERGIFQMYRPLDLDGGGLGRRGGRAHSLPAWAQLMYLIAALNSEDGGVDLAADNLRAIGVERAEPLKDMAYHCYLACDRAKRSAEAQDFNGLVTAWPELERRSRELSDQKLF